ncbi:MAG: hypothetical protein ACOC22_04615 [bacterium]
MDILNVIVTSKTSGLVVAIDSYPVHEEQLKDEVVAKAEKRYVDLCVDNGIDEVVAEESIEDGCIENEIHLFSIVWSYGQ